MAAKQHDTVSSADAIFRRHGGVMRTTEAVRAGIHPRTLYRMRDEGIVEQLARGLYRLAELPPLSQPDLATVALSAPNGVICLISALAFHELTTQIPHRVHIALLRGSQRPRLDYPPVQVYFFSDRPFREGIEEHETDGIRLRIYSPEKTLADCFKYRNKIGLDVAIEALVLYARSGRADVGALLRHARICRVETVMRPYLETVLR